MPHAHGDTCNVGYCPVLDGRDPFRKVLDYVEHGDADSLVAAALDIVYAHADTSDRATMITSAVDKYRGVDS